ncbi:MAG: hypothetical protein SPG61_04040 [Arcanobacterium sp.]|nr:hypothetical protein [Arcanobacterium sp.]
MPFPQANDSSKQKLPNSVRPALPSDASVIAALQVQSLAEKIVKATEVPLKPSTKALLDVDNFTQTWTETIQSLHPDQHVLLAVSNEKIHGFLSIARTPDEGDISKFEITNFEIDSRFSGMGHETRMLAAVTDIVHSTHSQAELYLWVFQSDEVLPRLLTEVGFAPAGMQREFEIDSQQVIQHLWWTTLE